MPERREMFATMEKADGELVLHRERVFPDDRPVRVIFYDVEVHPEPSLADNAPTLLLSDPIGITQIRINGGPWLTIGRTIISIFKEDEIRFRQLPRDWIAQPSSYVATPDPAEAKED